MDYDGDKTAAFNDSQADSEVTPSLEPFQPPDHPAGAVPATGVSFAHPADIHGPATDLLPRLRRLVEAATARVRAVEQENAQLDERVADLARQNVNLLAEQQALLSQVASLQEQITDLEKQHDQLTAQVAHLEQQVATLHDDRERLATVAAGQQEQLRQLQFARGQEQDVLLTLAEDLERLAQLPVSTSEHAHNTPTGDDSAQPDSTAPEENRTEPAASPVPAEPAPDAPVQTASPAPPSPPSPPVSETAAIESGSMPTVPAENAPPATDEIRPAATGEAFPSSYTVIAYPFARFSDLGQFQAAVQGLPDVQSVRVRRFAQGTLEMRVEYEGKAPLTSALRDLPLDVEEIQQEDPFQLRVRLRAASLL